MTSTGEKQVRISISIDSPLLYGFDQEILKMPPLCSPVWWMPVVLWELRNAWRLPKAKSCTAAKDLTEKGSSRVRGISMRGTRYPALHDLLDDPPHQRVPNRRKNSNQTHSVCPPHLTRYFKHSWLPMQPGLSIEKHDHIIVRSPPGRTMWQSLP